MTTAMPTRDQFIESWIRVSAGGSDTPEVRKYAGEIYDVLTDSSPETIKGIEEAVVSICEDLVARKNASPDR